jgi:Mrp family chromosome partitioning ATPase
MGSSVDDAIVSVERFDLLAAGPQPPNPGDLAVREVVPHIIEILRHRYDLVIIDAPPFLVLPDAARFLQAADSVMIVVRRRAARLYQVQRLIDRLNVLGAKPVGTVLNMSAPRDEDLAYGYPEAPGAAREPSPPIQPPKTGLFRRGRATSQVGRGRGPEDEDSIDEESRDDEESGRPASADGNGRAGDPQRPEPRR